MGWPETARWWGEGGLLGAPDLRLCAGDSEKRRALAPLTCLFIFTEKRGHPEEEAYRCEGVPERCWADGAGARLEGAPCVPSSALGTQQMPSRLLPTHEGLLWARVQGEECGVQAMLLSGPAQAARTGLWGLSELGPGSTRPTPRSPLPGFWAGPRLSQALSEQGAGETGMWTTARGGDEGVAGVRKGQHRPNFASCTKDKGAKAPPPGGEHPQ